jgi:uncharacterized protein YdaU (DUF1376 family)
MWNAGGYLPADAKKLAHICHCNARRWKAISGEVLSMFQIKNGRFTSHKMVEQIEKVTAKLDSKRRNGALGGKAKSLRYNAQALASASRSLDDSPLYARALTHIEASPDGSPPQKEEDVLVIRSDNPEYFATCVRLWNEEVPEWCSQQWFPLSVAERAKSAFTPQPSDVAESAGGL